MRGRGLEGKWLGRSAGACVYGFVWRVFLKSALLLFGILLMVVNWHNVDGKLLFNMHFYYFIHGIVGSSAECYADACLPISSWAPHTQ